MAAEPGGAPSCLRTPGVHMFVRSQELHRNSVCLLLLASELHVLLRFGVGS